MKYIFVTGGSFSGIGKGLLASSTGAILQSYGYTVTFLKVDPYLNYNAGRLEPSEHGETFVLRDGTEADLDLGNYQRFCNLLLDATNTLTSGKILYDIIRDEKEGSYNGKTLRFCTDFYEYIMKRMSILENKPVCMMVNGEKIYKKPDVIIIELGGTISDDESFFLVKSFARLFSTVERCDKCFITLDYMIEIGDIIKTKLLQNSLNNFKSFGISNDILIYRGKREMDDTSLEKVAQNCGINKENIIWSRETENQHEIVQDLDDHGLYASIKKILLLGDKQLFSLDQKFGIFTKIYEKTKTIGIVTRYLTNDQPYTRLEDALVSLGKLRGYEIKIVPINYIKLSQDDDEAFNLLRSVDGIIIPGGFGDLNVDTKVMVAQYARMNNIPFLGICLGFQIMIIEFARNVLNLQGASSEEFNPNANCFIIRKHPNINCVNTHEDIFLGEYIVEFGNIFRERIYKTERAEQIFRHRYSLDPKYEDDLNSAGMKIEGKTHDSRVVAVYLEHNTFHCGVQYHPELNSSLERVDPIIESYVEAVIKK